jgi:hypothetical protein
VLPAVVQFPLDDSIDLQRVDEPQEGHEERVDQEHDRLLLHDSVVLAVDVIESDIFDQDGQHSSRQEEGDGVFNREVVLFFGVGRMFLEIRD